MSHAADTSDSLNELEAHTDRESPSQLEYPQLLIEASFESLLSNSHRLQPPPAAAMPRSELSLSESWSSLSEHDLSRDDDLHSEVTDTGSLIDVSHTADVHTVDDDGEASDGDDNHDSCGDEAEDNHMQGSISSDEGSGGERNYQTYPVMHPHESFRLDDSITVVEANGETLMQASKFFTDSEMRAYSTHVNRNVFSSEMVGSIRMLMSLDSLRLGQRPYHVLYHGSTFASSEIKADVLGKIGAALISPGDHVELDDTSGSPCYHVVPSEFGPGSRPSTADLIPIPTQMHISVCTVADSLPQNRSEESICLQLGSGKYVTSRPAKVFEVRNKRHWPLPDLVVIVVSRNENGIGRSKARKVVKFANRHGIAVLCLRQEPGWDGDDFLADANPGMIHKRMQPAHLPDGHKSEIKMVLDVDSFLALDTEQLNLHLHHMTVSMASDSEARSGRVSRILAQVDQAYHQFVHPRSTPPTTGQNSKLASAHWVIEESSSENSRLSAHAPATPTKKIVWKLINNIFNEEILLRAALMIIMTASAMFIMSLFQTPLTQMSRDVLKSGDVINTPISVNSVPHTISSTSSVSTTATAKQSFALSGPLQVFEDKVQNWMPINMRGAKKNIESPPSKASPEVTALVDVKSCHNIVPAQYMSPSFKVDAAYFSAGDPAFHVHVRRGDETVHAQTKKQSDGTAVVMIKRKDYHGLLTIHLDGIAEQVCTVLDLENSLAETITLWAKSLRDQGQNVKTVKRFANEYTRLLEIRTTKEGLVNNALELQYTAGHGLGAAVEAVERTAIKHVKLCHKGQDQCFIRNIGFTKDISDSIKQARRVSEKFIHSTQSQISQTSKQARQGAYEMTEQAREEISKAMQVVQSSFENVGDEIRRQWPNKVLNKVSKTLAEAQLRARKLVRKPTSACKKSRGSR